MSDQAALRRELRDAVRDLLPCGSGAWARHAAELREHILTRDLSNFLWWPVVVNTIRYNPRCVYIPEELDYLERRKDYSGRWEPVLQESPVGLGMAAMPASQSTGNLIHTAYHAAMLEDVTGLHVGELAGVVEFGGGYGCLCRVLHGLGFAGGYILYDLPVLSALQRYYLKSLGRPILPAAEFAGTGIVCVSDLAELAALVGRLEGLRLFAATWSLSEVPLALRDAVAPLVAGFEAYLLAYQEGYEGMDNLGWFRRWRNGQPGVDWYDWPIMHLMTGNRYLMGAKCA